MCLAVWLCIGAKTVSGKILAIIFPITAFVAAGFEHYVANMYFIPKALLIKQLAPDVFWSQIGTTADSYEYLTWQPFLISNLLPVTIGIVIGGALLVGMVYWFVFLRNNTSTTEGYSRLAQRRQ